MTCSLMTRVGSTGVQMTKASDVQADLNKVMGPGTVLLGSEMPKMSHWSTGVFPIDCMLDGGFPVGRFTEVFGDYSTLKSYIALKAMASVQKKKGTVAYVDSEHSFDPEWAAELGGDPKSVLVQRPETGEEAISVMEMLIRAKYDLIIWDSIAASQPNQYATKKPGEDLQPGGQARMMSAALRRLNSANTTTSVMAINQTRTTIGMQSFGGPRDSMPGGKAMPFYASYRVRLVKAGKITEDREIWDGEKQIKVKRQIKQKIKATLEKSKLSAPHQEVWFDFDLRTGEVDEVNFIMGWLIENGFIETKGGGSYVLDGTDLGFEDISTRGRENFYQLLASNEAALTWTKNEMSRKWSLAHPGATTPAKSKAGSRSAKS